MNSLTATIEHLQKQLANDSENSEALVTLGNIALEIGRPIEAQQFLLKAFALEPWNQHVKTLLDSLTTENNKIDFNAIVLQIKQTLADDLRKKLIAGMTHGR